MHKRVNQAAAGMLRGLAGCTDCPVASGGTKGVRIADRDTIHGILDDLITLLFPGCHGHREMPTARVLPEMKRTLESAAARMKQQAARMFRYRGGG